MPSRALSTAPSGACSKARFWSALHAYQNLLLGLDPSVRHPLLPLRDVGRDRLGELLGRAAQRIGALLRHGLTDLRGLEYPVELAVDLGEQRLRHFRRADHPVPGADGVALSAGLLDWRDSRA